MSDDLDDLEAELEEDGGDRSKRLTPAQWAEIRAKWEGGTATLASLSREYGVRADTIQKRLKADGAIKGRNAHKIGSAVQSEIEDQAAINARRVFETKEDHYKYAHALAKLTMSSLLKPSQNKQPVSVANADITTIGKAAKALEILRKERYAILGLDKEDGDPDDMPELLVSELSPEQIDQIRATMRGEEDDIDLNLDDDVVVEDEEDLA